MLVSRVPATFLDLSLKTLMSITAYGYLIPRRHDNEEAMIRELMINHALVCMSGGFETQVT